METDNTRDAYNISKYDLAYIIIKDNAKTYEPYKGYIRFDRSKRKYFLAGKIVEETDVYPKYHTIALVPEKNIDFFKKSKKLVDKQKYIINVIFSHIEFITLSFEGLDWVK